MMKIYNIALIGFGGVNRSLARLIEEENDNWASEFGFNLRIVAVTDLKLGSVLSPNGIEPDTLLNIGFEEGGFKGLSGGCSEALNEQIIKKSPADIVVEATFTNPVDGEPAASHCRWALESGKHVVTTNKGPVALHGAELKQLAAQKGLFFEYEGAVMSGTPVIRMAKQTLAGAYLLGFQGILNGTSNYILGQMESGLSFEKALTQAQKLGYAEADPTADIEGFDVRLKVAVLANELLGASLSPATIPCKGIAHLTDDDLSEAARAGERWKLIGSAQKQANGDILASVCPKRLPLSHPLAGISGATNAVAFQTGLIDTVTVSGPGAGRIETAYALLSDIISIHKSISPIALREAS